MEEFVQTLKDAHEEVMAQLIGSFNLSSVFSGSSEGRGVISSFMAFTAAVDWTEPFFLYLLAFHAAVWVGVILWAKTAGRILATMIAVMLVVLPASHVNEWAGRHYKLFFREDVNYFDEGGIFISVVLSAPFLVLAFVVQVRLLLSAASLMIKVKRLKIKAEQQQQQQPPEQAGGQNSNGKNKKKKGGGSEDEKKKEKEGGKKKKEN